MSPDWATPPPITIVSGARTTMMLVNVMAIQYATSLKAAKAFSSPATAFFYASSAVFVPASFATTHWSVKLNDLMGDLTCGATCTQMNFAVDDNTAANSCSHYKACNSSFTKCCAHDGFTQGERSRIVDNCSR
jgi:hypothetical protein